MTKTSEPLFPAVRDDLPGGISLRDHIALSLADASIQLNDIEAGVAIVGRPFPDTTVEQVEWQFDMIAKIRYMYADAMLRERNEEGPTP